MQERRTERRREGGRGAGKKGKGNHQIRYSYGKMFWEPGEFKKLNNYDSNFTKRPLSKSRVVEN